jgi:hypothetical protein
MRFLALLACLLPLALAGCGNSDHGSAGASDGDGSAGGGSANDIEGDSAGTSSGEDVLADDVLLTIDGNHEVLGGAARIEVRELDPLVRLTVTTVFPTNHDDLILIQLGVQGVENMMGQHIESFTSTEDGAALAVAYLKQVSYSSQSGSLDVTLSNDGKLEGRFDAQLTPDALAGEAPPAAEPLSIAGHFAGKWSVLCRSPVLNLPGDHSTSDSAYCRNLEF